MIKKAILAILLLPFIAFGQGFEFIPQTSPDTSAAGSLLQLSTGEIIAVSDYIMLSSDKGETWDAGYYWQDGQLLDSRLYYTSMSRLGEAADGSVFGFRNSSILSISTDKGKTWEDRGFAVFAFYAGGLFYKASYNDHNLKTQVSYDFGKNWVDTTIFPDTKLSFFFGDTEGNIGATIDDGNKFIIKKISGKTISDTLEGDKKIKTGELENGILSSVLADTSKYYIYLYDLKEEKRLALYPIDIIEEAPKYMYNLDSRVFFLQIEPHKDDGSKKVYRFEYDDVSKKLSYKQIELPFYKFVEFAVLDNKLLALTNGAIYISEDKGKTWAHHNPIKGQSSVKQLYITENEIIAQIDNSYDFLYASPFNAKLDWKLHKAFDSTGEIYGGNIYVDKVGHIYFWFETMYAWNGSEWISDLLPKIRVKKISSAKDGSVYVLGATSEKSVVYYKEAKDFHFTKIFEMADFDADIAASNHKLIVLQRDSGNVFFHTSTDKGKSWTTTLESIPEDLGNRFFSKTLMNNGNMYINSYIGAFLYDPNTKQMMKVTDSVEAGYFSGILKFRDQALAYNNKEFYILDSEGKLKHKFHHSFGYISCYASYGDEYLWVLNNQGIFKSNGIITNVVEGEIKEEPVLYPVPARNELNVEYPGEVEYVIINTAGGKAFSGIFTNSAQINISGLSSGAYTIIISSGSKSIARTFIVE